MRHIRKRAHTDVTSFTRIMLLGAAVSVWSMPAFAQAAGDRRTDNDVKTLLEQVDTSRDKFEGNLDGGFKGSTLRDANAEVKVEAALQDYQDNVKKLKERFTDDYSASAEVSTVLRQAARFDKFLKDTPTVTKGRSEWEHHVTDLKHLATIYDTTFPMPDGASARRINDKETASIAKDLADAADHVKDDFGKVPVATLPKTDQDGIKKSLDLLIKQAKTVSSRAGDHKPASTEAHQVVTQVAVVQKFIDAHPVPTVTTNWQAVHAALGKLEQAFNMK